MAGVAVVDDCKRRDVAVAETWALEEDSRRGAEYAEKIKFYAEARSCGVEAVADVSVAG